MSLLVLIIILLFIAALAWAVNTRFADKINPVIRFLINCVLAITAAVIVLDAIGVWDQVKAVKVPSL